MKNTNNLYTVQTIDKTIDLYEIRCYDETVILNYIKTMIAEPDEERRIQRASAIMYEIENGNAFTAVSASSKTTFRKATPSDISISKKFEKLEEEENKEWLSKDANKDFIKRLANAIGGIEEREIESYFNDLKV